MDVLDAGVFVSRWEASLPDKLRPVLWGPLQAKEMGLEGWEVQDGGETGLVYHRHARASTGHATATLIVVNRLKKAYLTVYLGGYPADVPAAQRRTEAQRMATAAQTFLTRLAKEPVQFEHTGDWALVDHTEAARASTGSRDVLGGGRLRKSGPIEEA